MTVFSRAISERKAAAFELQDAYFIALTTGASAPILGSRSSRISK